MACYFVLPVFIKQTNQLKMTRLDKTTELSMKKLCQMLQIRDVMLAINKFAWMLKEEQSLTTMMKKILIVIG